MVVVPQFLKLHNVGCGVTVLQNMASSIKQHNYLWFYIIGSPEVPNRHTVAMAEKVKYNKNKLRICIFNYCNNSGSES